MSPNNQDCIFCQITKKELPAFVVYEDENFLAFLDRRPIFFGHSLLIPKPHRVTFYDLPPSLLQPYYVVLQKIGRGVEKAMQAEGSFIATNNRVSQSVPHFHTHIVPRNKGDGLKGFFWPRHQYASEEQMSETCEKIKAAILI